MIRGLVYGRLPNSKQNYCDLRVSQHGHMSDNFVDDIGLIANVGVLRVSDILGRAKVFEGQ